MIWLTLVASLSSREAHAAFDCAPASLRGFSGNASLVLMGDEGRTPAPQTVRVEGGSFTLDGLPRTGMARVLLEDGRALVVGWHQSGTLGRAPEANCMQVVAATSATVRGVLTIGADIPVEDALITACGWETRTDAEGRFTLPTPTGACELAAFPLRDQVTECRTHIVTAGDGENVEVALQLPVRHPGLAGLAPDKSPKPGTGLLPVVVIALDSAAAEAGVQVGDLIASIDGRSVRGWSEPRVCEHLVGAAGAPLVLELLRGDQALKVELIRRAQPDP